MGQITAPVERRAPPIPIKALGESLNRFLSLLYRDLASGCHAVTLSRRSNCQTRPCSYDYLG